MSIITTVPFIEIDGKKTPMPKPNLKLWRRMVGFDEKRQSGRLDNMEILDEMVTIVMIAFRMDPEDDKQRDVVEENVGIEEIPVLFGYIQNKVVSKVNIKSAQLVASAKNGGTPART